VCGGGVRGKTGHQTEKHKTRQKKRGRPRPKNVGPGRGATSPRWGCPHDKKGATPNNDREEPQISQKFCTQPSEGKTHKTEWGGGGLPQNDPSGGTIRGKKTQCPSQKDQKKNTEKKVFLTKRPLSLRVTLRGQGRGGKNQLFFTAGEKTGKVKRYPHPTWGGRVVNTRKPERYLGGGGGGPQKKNVGCWLHQKTQEKKNWGFERKKKLFSGLGKRKKKKSKKRAGGGGNALTGKNWGTPAPPKEQQW